MLPSEMLRLGRSEGRSAVAVGLAGAAALHLAVWFAIPGDLFFISPADSGQRQYQEYAIELAPAAAESGPDAAPGRIYTDTASDPSAADPGPTDFFGEDNQSASSPEAPPLDARSEAPAEDAFNAADGPAPTGNETAEEPAPALDEPANPIARPSSSAAIAALLGPRASGSAASWRDFFEPPQTDATGERDRPSAPRVTPVDPAEPFLPEPAFEPVTEPDAPEPAETEAEPEEEPLATFEPEPPSDVFDRGLLGQPLPRPRLEFVPPGARRPILADLSEFGPAREAVQQGPWGTYSKVMTARIRGRFDQYLLDLPEGDRGGHVRVHFTLSSDGTVSDFEVEALEGTELFRQHCQQSVAESQPFGEWSWTLIDLYGHDHRVTYEFFYDGGDL